MGIDDIKQEVYCRNNMGVTTLAYREKVGMWDIYNVFYISEAMANQPIEIYK